MKITTILAALLALVIATPAAFAKKPKGESASSGAFGKYDKNGNGVLDADEKEAVKKAFATDPDLAKYDTNGDKALDDNEVAAIKPDSAGAKKKKR